MDLRLGFPSLERITLVRIGEDLVNQLFWSYRPTAEQMKNPDYCYLISDTIPTLIEEAVDSYTAPTLLKSKILDISLLMWDVACKVCVDWHQSSRAYEYPEVTNAVWTNLHFDTDGKLDLPRMHKEALESIMRENIYDLEVQYGLACEFCLEDAARAIFFRMNNMQRQSSCAMHPISIYWHNFVSGCTCKLENTSLYLQILRQYMTREPSIEYAIVYFWKKLNEQTKDAVVEECMKYAGLFSLPEFMCRLLEHLTPERFVMISSRMAFDVLNCLLLWPYTELFLDVFKCLWGHLSTEDRESLFIQLIDVRGHALCYTIQHFRQELWKKCTTSIRLYILQSKYLCVDYLMFLRFNLKDANTYNLLLADVCKFYPCEDVAGILGQVDEYKCHALP